MKKKLFNESVTYLNTSLISRLNKDRFFLILALSGIFLRGLYLFEYSHFLNFDLAIGADVGEYISRAREILNGVFLPAAPEIHAPLYSFFLAGLLSSGANIVAIRIIQTLLNYISWTALYWLMEKKGISHPVRLVFFGLSMVLAPIIFHPAELISEALLLPIYTLVFIMLHCSSQAACKKKEYLYGSVAGVFSAMAALTHGLSLAFIVLTAIYLFILKKWQNALLYLAGSIVILLPVIAVKSSFYGKTTFLQANSGFNIFLGNNPKANGECYMRPGNVWRKSHVQAAKKAAERSISTDRYWLEQAFDFWKKTPGKAAILYKNKFISIFSGKELIAGADGGFLFCRSDSMNLLRFLTFPVFCFAIAGLWYIFKSRKEPLWWPPLILTLALFIMQMLTVTSGRYRLLMFPGIIYLAAAGITYVNWRKIYLLFILILLLTVWKTYNFLGKDKAEGSALLGEAAFIKGDLAHAGELLLFASKRFKDSSRVENMLGMIAEKQGDLKTAEKYYRSVTKTEPFMPEGWMNLANITKDPILAEKYFKNAIACSYSPPGADLYFNYARLLYSAKRTQEAQKMLRHAIGLNKDHVLSYNLLGIICMESGAFAEAAEKFFIAAELKGTEPGFWRNAAIAARYAGNKQLEQKAAARFSQLSKQRSKH